MDNLIITIGREFGSNGRLVGEKTAEKLGIKCYDKELLSLAAKNSGFCEDILKNNDEKPTGSFLYSLVMDTYSMNGYASAPFLDIPLNQKVFLAQYQTIQKIAQEESCVIVGRCADYALQKHQNCINVFIHANKDARIAEISKRLDIPANKAKDVMQKQDKQRASYYHYYSNQAWGDSRNYDLTLDSSKLGIDGCVDMILKYKDLMIGK
ncbi:MAG: cytidylate kinase-like family protein [Lachnospiraceae bacterium]|nr:cytidylate kinase-like family protein [Lachnospiraceae bacterium]MDD6183699.1 cytidylate kinase-like family protein [Lachnospiraceae bacterium]MDD7377803.1 cytidylate kinase-like family protein [Lachnospiraceae bacterium]MDY4616136.1 cytidylate kinase-like family protein [Lachnospiraceae bacterium]